MCGFEDAPIATWKDGGRARITEYRAARLVGEDGSFGLPETVTLDDGRDGHDWLREALAFPDREVFRYGCIREALASAWYQSASGGWNGNVYFSRGRLLLDTLMGDFGILSLGPQRSCGVLACSDPLREYDTREARAAAPPWASVELEALCQELDSWCHRGPTSMFWTQDRLLAGAEPFHVIYGYGFEPLCDTLCDDDAWRACVAEAFGEDLTPAVAQDIIDITQEFVRTGKPVRPTPEAMARLFPKDAPGREEALEALTNPEGFIELLAL